MFNILKEIQGKPESMRKKQDTIKNDQNDSNKIKFLENKNLIIEIKTH